jgi:monomeric isocitrate dehydrogenase
MIRANRADFYEREMEHARKTGVMFSLHLKATMMKISHPIVFSIPSGSIYKDAFVKVRVWRSELSRFRLVQYHGRGYYRQQLRSSNVRRRHHRKL